jgi:hypothetical protein
MSLGCLFESCEIQGSVVERGSALPCSELHSHTFYAESEIHIIGDAHLLMPGRLG